MKNFILFLLRITSCLLFQWFTYYVCNGQGSFFLTQQSRVVLSQKAKMSCYSVSWLGDARVHLADSASWCVHGNISGVDTISRFFTLGKDASLQRKIDTVAPYLFPIGYAPHSYTYRGFTLDIKSLGTTGDSFVSVRLIPNISGSIHYEKYFPSSDPSCVAGSMVTFDCLGSDGWHCDGPPDYEYVANAFTMNTCGGSTRRMIKTATGTNMWQDSVESIVGDLATNLCEYSDWNGIGNSVPGGMYRDFSDFTIASSMYALPITLIDLRADVIHQKCIRVSWGTEVEVNNDRFVVERSTDGVTFTAIGQVAGFGTTTTPQEYFFDDSQPELNTDYYYRLEQVDYNGTIHASSIVSARITGDQEGLGVIKRFTILGQEISEEVSGIQIVQTRNQSGVICSKIFKPLP